MPPRLLKIVTSLSSPTSSPITTRTFKWYHLQIQDTSSSACSLSSTHACGVKVSYHTTTACAAKPFHLENGGKQTRPKNLPVEESFPHVSPLRKTRCCFKRSSSLLFWPFPLELVLLISELFTRCLTSTSLLQFLLSISVTYHRRR